MGNVMSGEATLNAGALPQEEACVEEGRELARLRAEYRRLLDNTPHGVFQADSEGRFISVNQSFAVMLGYDSPLALLAERPSFADLCPYADAGQAMLAALKDQPGRRRDVVLFQRGGKRRNFSIVSLRPLPANGGLPEVVDGFLLDRTAEEQAALARQQRDRAVRQSASLALLLASISRQSQEYLIPGHHCTLPEEDVAHISPSSGGAERGRSATGDGPVRAKELFSRMGKAEERRKGTYSLNAVFDDIYKIAVAEAEGAPLVAVPIDLDRLMDSLCLQALPAMQSKSVDLFREMEEGLITRVSGSSSLLRHAMLRALLAVTAPVYGGRAYFSVSRDPNAPRVPGSSRLIFSASWAAGDTGASSGGEQTEDVAANDPALTYCAAIGLENDPGLPGGIVGDGKDGRRADSGGTPRIMDGMSLNIAEERSVISFLVRKMRGELLDDILAEKRRSMRFTVQLEHFALEAEDLAAAQAAAPGKADIFGTPACEAGEEGFFAGDAGDEGSAGSVLEDLPVGLEEGLSLPVMDVDPDVTEKESTGERGLDILLVDDNMNNRMLFSLFLRGTRHRITEARDGQEGVESFQHKKFDVIFMDMEMPLMDGYQATRIIRALEDDAGLPPTPIVAQTAHVLPEFKQQCILSGCTEFLSKPFSKNALLTMLDAIAQLKADNGR